MGHIVLFVDGPHFFFFLHSMTRRDSDGALQRRDNARCRCARPVQARASECMRGEAWRPRAVDMVRFEGMLGRTQLVPRRAPAPTPPPPRGATLDKNNWDLGELM